MFRYSSSGIMLRKLIAVAIFALFFATCSSIGIASETPNICIILVDDMGYGDPGCFNPNSKIATPNIDSIAKSGMRFTDAHAPGPLCHMSRYGLLTGRYPFRTDVSRWPKNALIEPSQETIATLAKRQGYRTAMVGKWHVGFHEQGYDRPLKGGPLDCGFDSFFGMRASTDIPPYFYIRGDRAVVPPTDHIAASSSQDWSPIQGEFYRAGGIAPNLELQDVLPCFTNEATEIINNHKKLPANSKQPLLLYLAYPAPHTPWLPSKEFVGKSGAGQYGDFAMMVDAEIGRVLKALDEANMADDTLLIFTSDNGPVWLAEDIERFEHKSTGTFRGMKSDAWEGGHRMPLIIRWPGHVDKYSTSDQLVCFTDFMATFASVMGIQLPEDAGPDSIDFLPALLDKSVADQSLRKQLVMQAGSHKTTMAIRDGDWKLITNLGSGGFSKPTFTEPVEDGPAGQLYNMTNDPGESTNLYQEQPKIVARLVSSLGQTVRKEKTYKVRAKTNDNTIDRSTLKGKVMCGYQGWFNTPDDGMGLDWKHWARREHGTFAPGNVTVDLWPDVSELDPDERYATKFKNSDGSAAEVYSSVNPKTIMRHFNWMQDYGIDGVFLQRFANGLNHDKLLPNKNKVLAGVRVAAEKTGRVYALMYDLSGLASGECSRVYEDWKTLQRTQNIISDAAYLKHNGKPLVAIWGVGFVDGKKERDYSIAECRELIIKLKEAGCSIMLGVPTGWRELTRDSVSDPKLHELLQLSDVISPWTVGRYRDPKGVQAHAERYWAPDVSWCEEHELDYMPVAFPGFSWYNLKGAKLGDIPRLKGKFLWSQFVAAKRSGAEMIYVAMFDEVDEATAIFKCTDQPPVGKGVSFLTNDGLPSDHYLWLTGQGGRMFRGELPALKRLPRRDLAELENSSSD